MFFLFLFKIVVLMTRSLLLLVFGRATAGVHCIIPVMTLIVIATMIVSIILMFLLVSITTGQNYPLLAFLWWRR